MQIQTTQNLGTVLKKLLAFGTPPADTFLYQNIAQKIQSKDEDNTQDFIKKIEKRYAKAKAKILSRPAQSTQKKLSKKAQKIALYTDDICKHYGEVDEKLLLNVIKSLSTSIYKDSTETLCFDKPKELLTVRRNFLIKKLSVKRSEKVLDKSIQAIQDEVKQNTIYRATLYYRLAQKFKKESVLNR
jgi:ribosomal protein L9